MHGIAGMAAILLLWSQPVLGQSDPPAAAGTSRGENFSAKPAPQLFATDCTGGGCHKGPQGLGKNYGQFGLTTFLREHYTNSRQSAAALAEYLLRSQAATETRNRGGAGLAVAAGDAPRCRTQRRQARRGRAHSARPTHHGGNAHGRTHGHNAPHGRNSGTGANAAAGGAGTASASRTKAIRHLRLIG
jgi:hypothetical protein